MQNQIFDSLVSKLAVHFCTAHPLQSGTGVRFQSVQRGKLTVYHSNLATGNQAEIAFDPITIAKRMSVTEQKLRTLIADFRLKTGRDVKPDPQFNWPRVGFVDSADVESVVTAIERGISAI